MGERKDAQGIEVGLGMGSRCEESRDFSSPPTVVFPGSLPWSQQINREIYDQGILCHRAPVAGPSRLKTAEPCW